MDRLDIIIELARNNVPADRIKRAMEAAFPAAGQNPAPMAQVQNPAPMSQVQNPAPTAQAQNPAPMAQVQNPHPVQLAGEIEKAVGPVGYPELVARIEALTNTVRGMAVAGSRQPKTPNVDDPLGDMFAQIVPPEYRKE